MKRRNEIRKTSIHITHVLIFTHSYTDMKDPSYLRLSTSCNNNDAEVTMSALRTCQVIRHIFAVYVINKLQERSNEKVKKKRFFWFLVVIQCYYSCMYVAVFIFVGFDCCYPIRTFRKKKHKK